MSGTSIIAKFSMSLTVWVVATCSNTSIFAISCVDIDGPQYKYMFALPHITC